MLEKVTRIRIGEPAQRANDAAFIAVRLIGEVLRTGFGSLRRRTLVITLVSNIFMLTTSVYAVKPETTQFDSELGFVIEYPTSWYTYATDRKNLNIISGNRRLEAVIIPRGEAMISVFKSEPVKDGNYLSLFRTSPGDEILDYKSIRLGGPPGNSCEKVYLIESRSEIGPDSFQIEKHFYCPIGERLFVLKLSCWQDDRAAPNGYDVAVTMLKSLRLR